MATILRPRGGTGVQTHAMEVARGLRQRHVPVAVVTPHAVGGPVKWVLFGVRRLVAPISGSLDVWWYRFWHRLYLQRALRTRLRGAGSGTVVYAQCPVSAFAAMRVAQGVPVVLAVHYCGSQADEWARKCRIKWNGRLFRSIRRFEHRVLDEVDGVVFVSSAARDRLQGFPRAGVPTATIPNFLSRRAQCVDRPERIADLVSVGALEEGKNHRFLLDVLDAARRKGHCYSLDIIGTGPERRRLLQRSAELGIQDQVRLLGYVPDAASRLAGYSAYVHASSSESMGLALVEAMAAGTPVVAAPVGGVPEVFRTSAEGVYWDLNDAAAAADLLIGLMEDEGRLAMMGAAARDRYRTCFDSDVVCPILYDFLTARIALPVANGPMPAGGRRRTVGSGRSARRGGESSTPCSDGRATGTAVDGRIR